LTGELPAGALCAVHAEQDAIFICTRCGSYGCADCVFSDVAGREMCLACSTGGLAEVLPWERRRDIGWWKAFWRTTRLVLSEPTATFRTPSAEAGIGGPLLYGVLAYTVGQLIVLVLLVLFMVVMGVALGAATGEAGIAALFAGYGICIVPLTLVQVPVYALIGIIMGGGLSHFTLYLMKKATVPFEQTLRAVSFANAPHVFDIFQCVSIPWVIAAETIAIRETHRVSTGTALVATLGWRVLFFGLAVGAYVALIGLVLVAEQR